MTKLIRPDNYQPAEYVATLRGHICLRMLDTVTPAVRWYSLASVVAVNGRAQVAEACKTPETPRHTVKAIDMGYEFGCTPPLWLVEYLRRQLDNLDALTEILNTRKPERYIPRDFYVTDLYAEIQDALAA